MGLLAAAFITRLWIAGRSRFRTMVGFSCRRGFTGDGDWSLIFLRFMGRPSGNPIRSELCLKLSFWHGIAKRCFGVRRGVVSSAIGAARFSFSKRTTFRQWYTAPEIVCETPLLNPEEARRDRA